MLEWQVQPLLLLLEFFALLQCASTARANDAPAAHLDTKFLNELCVCLSLLVVWINLRSPLKAILRRDVDPRGNVLKNLARLPE